MYQYSQDEVLSCLTNAPNLNAAVKRYLKLEDAGAEDDARFVKALRAAAKSGKEPPLKNLVEKALPKYERQFYLIVRSAYDQPVSDIVEAIFENFAEDFNATYSLEGDKLSFTEEAEFHRISQQALRKIDEMISEKALPNVNFLRNAVAVTLFEPGVLEHIKFSST